MVEPAPWSDSKGAITFDAFSVAGLKLKTGEFNGSGMAPSILSSEGAAFYPVCMVLRACPLVIHNRALDHRSTTGAAVSVLMRQ
jgi:hypothetical protein